MSEREFVDRQRARGFSWQAIGRQVGKCVADLRAAYDKTYDRIALEAVAVPVIPTAPRPPLADTPMKKRIRHAWGLTQREADVLEVLMVSDKITKEDIAIIIYSAEKFVDATIVKVYISKLRRKLGPYGVKIASAKTGQYSLSPEMKRVVASLLAEREAA